MLEAESVSGTGSLSSLSRITGLALARFWLVFKVLPLFVPPRPFVFVATSSVLLLPFLSFFDPSLHSFCSPILSTFNL